MHQIGGGRQYISIDLATEQWQVHLISATMIERHLGGESLALALWSTFNEADPESDPICLAGGALSGSSVMCSASLSMAGRSPATNLVESDTAMAPFAGAMVSCGWRALVFTGIARRQMVVAIHADSVEFIPSDRLIGKPVFETIGLLASEGSSSVLAIGPAGERRNPYATAVHEGYPVERRGFGALLGKKHLKAIVVDHGPMEFVPFDAERFQQAQERLSQLAGHSPYVARFKKKGSLEMIDTAMSKGFAAVKGNSKRTDPRLFHLGPDECSRKFSLDIDPCIDCPLGCKRKVMRPGGEDLALPDVYGMMALGSNLENYDASVVIQWWHQCLDLGLHPVSTGMVAGTLIGQGRSLATKYKDVEDVSRLFEVIARGGIEIHPTQEQTDVMVHGRPMVPIDPRGAWAAALLIGTGEDFPSVPDMLLRWTFSTNEESKVGWVVLQENLLAIVRSLGICPQLMLPLLFEQAAVPLQALSRIPKLRSLGIPLSVLSDLAESMSGVVFSEDWLMHLGRRTIMMKRELNHGTSDPPWNIPLRFTTDPESNHPTPKIVPYSRLVDRYRFLRTLDLARLGGEA